MLLLSCLSSLTYISTGVALECLQTFSRVKVCLRKCVMLMFLEKKTPKAINGLLLSTDFFRRSK